MASNTHTLWIKGDDASFMAGNATDPRTEMRWTTTYTSGENMFDADVFIVPGTDHPPSCRSTPLPPTALMLSAWADGTVRYYIGNGDGPIIKSNGSKAGEISR